MQFGPEPSIVLARQLAADADAEVRARRLSCWRGIQQSKPAPT